MQRALLLLAFTLAGCTVGGGPGPGPAAPARPRDDLIPSAVLDHQDPGADTSKNPVRSRVGGDSALGSFFRDFPNPFASRAPDPFSGPASPPHYYRGCGGCAADRPAALADLGALAPALALAAALARRRRQRRRRYPRSGGVTLKIAARLRTSLSKLSEVRRSFTISIILVISS